MHPSSGAGHLTPIWEACTKKTNPRRIQQVLICDAMPQLSVANTISKYFVPIFEITSAYGDGTRKIFLTGMCTMAGFFLALINSFLLLDALQRRKSLYLGITLQIVSNI